MKRSVQFLSLFITYTIIGASFIFMLAAIQIPFSARAEECWDCAADSGDSVDDGSDYGTNYGTQYYDQSANYQAPPVTSGYQSPVQSQAQCLDDLNYCDNGRYIHKHGGYPNGGANSINGCVYAFDDIGACPAPAAVVTTPYQPVPPPPVVYQPSYQPPPTYYPPQPVNYGYQPPYIPPPVYQPPMYQQPNYQQTPQYGYNPQPYPYPQPYPQQYPSYQAQIPLYQQAYYPAPTPFYLPPIVPPPPAQYVYQIPTQPQPQNITNNIYVTQNVTVPGYPNTQQAVYVPPPTPTPIPTPTPASVTAQIPVNQGNPTNSYCPPGMQASFEDNRIVCRTVIIQQQPVIVQAANPQPQIVYQPPVIQQPPAQVLVANPPVVSAPQVVYQQAPIQPAPAVTYQQPVVLAGLQELPKTGLPALAWIIFGSVPLGFSLRRFGSRNLQRKTNSQFIWEERIFKST